jgi:hypothetical protein
MATVAGAAKAIAPATAIAQIGSLAKEVQDVISPSRRRRLLDRRPRPKMKAPNAASVHAHRRDRGAWGRLSSSCLSDLSHDA